MIRRVLGGLCLLVLAAACAVLEVFYLPLRAGSVLVPVSILAAVAANVVLTKAMYELTRSVWAALLPGAVWLVIVAPAVTAQPEGDLLIRTGEPYTALVMVNLAFLLLGALALAYAVGTLRRPKPTEGSPATIGTYESSPDRARETAQPPDTAGRR